MAKTTSTPDTEVHDLTVVEIGRLVANYTRDRQAAVAELADLFASRVPGAAAPVPPSDTDRAIREEARRLINGYSSPNAFALPTFTSRETELEIRVGGLDLVLDALSRRETVARATEAAAWLEEHGAGWRALVRDIVLAADHLRALESRAIAVRSAVSGNAHILPMGEFIGTGRSIVGAAWGADPASRARTAALALGIISRHDIKEASEV